VQKVQKAVKEKLVSPGILVIADFQVSLEAAVRKVLGGMMDLKDSQAPKAKQVCIQLSIMVPPDRWILY